MEALGSKRKPKRSPFVGCLVVLLAAVGITVALFLGTDQLCRSDINRRLPFYPDAALVSAEHNGIRLRATGTTTLVFSTPDDPEIVREWYRQLTLQQLNENKARGLADIQRSAEPNPEGQGTLIYYATECGI